MKFETAVKVVKAGAAITSTVGAAVAGAWVKQKIHEDLLDQLDVSDWAEVFLDTSTDVFVNGITTVADMAAIDALWKSIDGYAMLFKGIANAAKAA